MNALPRGCGRPQLSTCAPTGRSVTMIQRRRRPVLWLCGQSAHRQCNLPRSHAVGRQYEIGVRPDDAFPTLADCCAALVDVDCHAIVAGAPRDELARGACQRRNADHRSRRSPCCRLSRARRRIGPFSDVRLASSPRGLHIRLPRASAVLRSAETATALPAVGGEPVTRLAQADAAEGARKGSGRLAIAVVRRWTEPQECLSRRA
jgi:hypothetical protein